MSRFAIIVFDDHEAGARREYSVPATNELDARLLAFVLDGGLEPAKYNRGSIIEDGEVELARMWTEVVGCEP